MKLDGLPLFVLGPDFFPGFTGTLRVFEPRYKQMMDDCIMDSRPFGYISADPNRGELNGWSQPSDHGVLCYVRDYEESGSNLIIEVEATTAFAVKDVIQPVLPSLVDSERFPGVEELMEVAGNPEGGKLYLRADVEVLGPPDVDYDEEAFTTFLSLLAPARQLLQMSSMYKGQILEFKEPEDYDGDLDRADLVWKVCCAVCYDVYLQQEMLSQTSFSALIDICTNRVVEILVMMEEE
ncbi:MAG: LON peptidase substrate-binding domain-containing protein [Candidatus Thermoplasmatota archaeon]|nr:LON peptidase substrate-binding domain-containing protein [Candidatus Thermoplasmatota archaeon]